MIRPEFIFIGTKKVKISLQDVEAPTFSVDIRLTDGSKVVKPYAPAALYPPRKIPGIHFC
jgi:hypothetical protein